MSLILDSNYVSLTEAIEGTAAPQEVRDSLVLIDVQYLSFDDALHAGQIVMHHSHADDITALFKLLLAEQFPVKKVVPIVAYGWDDDLSMESNNSSGFNYRPIAGTDRLSMHCGHAFDLNPCQNPFIGKDGIFPAGAVYEPLASGTLVRDGRIVQFMLELGWTWGGNWTEPIDYQHFEKKIVS